MLGQEKYKRSLEHCVALQSKKVLKELWRHQKDTKASSMSLSLAGSGTISGLKKGRTDSNSLSVTQTMVHTNKSKQMNE